jgi:hypothetical protein
MDNEELRRVAYRRIEQYVRKIRPDATQWDFTYDGFFNPTTNRIRIFVDGTRYTRFLKW